MKKSKARSRRVLSKEEVYKLLIEKYETLLDEDLAHDYFDRAKDDLVFLRVLARGLNQQLEDVIPDAEERVEEVYSALEKVCMEKVKSEMENGKYFLAVYDINCLEQTANNLGRMLSAQLQTSRDELQLKEHAKCFLQHLVKAVENSREKPYIAKDELKKALEYAGCMKLPIEGLCELRDRIVENMWKDEYGKSIVENIRTGNLLSAQFNVERFERTIEELVLR